MVEGVWVVHVEVTVKATAAIGLTRRNTLHSMSNPLVFVPVARQRVVTLVTISLGMDSSSEARGFPQFHHIGLQQA